MVKVQRFEELKSWQKARELTNAVFEVTQQKTFARDFDLRNQIRRSSSSVMHNIAEGFDAGLDAEFVRFLRFSLRSASETQSQLYLALDQKYISEEQFNQIFELCTEVKKTDQRFFTLPGKRIAHCSFVLTI